MKKLFLFALGLALTAAQSAVAAEGDVGTQAFQWPAYKALDSTTYPNGLAFSALQGKVVLLFVFQYSCGGCQANAPNIGKLADSLGSGKNEVPFQAIGCEIDNGTFLDIANFKTQHLVTNAPNVNFPLLHVPYDTAIDKTMTAHPGGTWWNRYNCYRDSYFVIDHTGKIMFRFDGSFSSAMPPTEMDSIKTALVSAIASTPTGILCIRGCDSPFGLTAHQDAGGFHFSLSNGAVNGPVSLQIFDFQGRTIRALLIPGAGGQAEWNGLDSHGNQVPFGPYYLRATGAGLSVSRRLNWLP